MADKGHELTDDILAKLEQDIADEYAIAVRDMRNKLTEYLEKDEAKRQIQEKLLNDGAITQQEYNEWCYRHMMMGKRWENMLNALAKDMTKTKEIALKISREKQPDVCALNVNYATYQIEHDGEIDTGLSLYNHDAAAHLLEEQRQLMPGPSTKKAAEIAANADMQWNYKKIQSAVLQGILQGESPYDVAKRLNTVGRMNYNDSVRYARTMTTNSQNAGRYQAFRRARDIGVDLTIEWQATLDGRTRHSHRMMHGQRRDVDEPFELDGVKIMWPGNDKVGSSDVPQSMIWNCRCTLLSWVKGFEGETVKESPKMGDMSFEEWQGYKAMSSGSGNERTNPGELISPEELRKFADQAKTRGYRFAPDVRGISRPTYGGFESYRGDPAELYKIIDELDASKSLWPDRLKRKSVLLGYESLGNTDDFARTAGRTILFNKDVYDDHDLLKRSYLEAVKDGVFVKGTTHTAVPWHEIGHVIQNADSRIYTRLKKAIGQRGEIRQIGLQLTSTYGITETRDIEYPELLSELLSATRSSDSAIRKSALELVKEVLP